MNAESKAILEALQSLREGGKITQQQGVMTDPAQGGGNARTYTALLAGRDPEQLQEQHRQQQLQWQQLQQQPQASTGQYEAEKPQGIDPEFFRPYTQIVGMESQGSLIPQAETPNANQPAPESQYPPIIAGLSNKELRSLINKLHGTKSGKRGAASSRMKRDELLAKAAEAMGYERKPIQGFNIQPPAKPGGSGASTPATSAFASSMEIATSALANVPESLAGYQPPPAPEPTPAAFASFAGGGKPWQAPGQEAPAPGPRDTSTFSYATSALSNTPNADPRLLALQRSHVAASTEQSTAEPAPLASLPRVPASPLPPDLKSQADTGAIPATAAVRPESPIVTSTPQATSTRQTATPQLPASLADQLGSLSTVATMAPVASGNYSPVTAQNFKPPVSAYGVGPGMGAAGAGVSPGTPPVSIPTADRQQTLTEALDRLRETISEANRHEKTVADETKDLSMGERLARLHQSGHLLSEDQVKLATLKANVTPHDIVRESERQEQRKRDEQREGRKSAIGEAGENLTKTIGERTESLISKIAGPRIGQQAGQFAGKLASPLIQGIVKHAGGIMPGVAGGASGAAGAAGGTTGGLGGAVAGLGKLAVANPYTALAAGAVAAEMALLKIPSATERFASSLMESNRRLMMYNAQLGNTYIKLDYQKRLLDIQQANATAGSGSALGDELARLREETQWMRELAGTLKNSLGRLLVAGGRLANAIIKLDPGIKAAVAIATALERLADMDWKLGIFSLGKNMERLGDEMEKANRKEGEDWQPVWSLLQGLSKIDEKPGYGPKNKKPDKPNGPGGR